MEHIGLRIRQLRKEQKLTLEGLAGNKLSKGMLSLIENGKAQPSMESLTYIAQRLGVDKSDLLEEISLSEIRNVLEDVEKLYKVDLADLQDEYQTILGLIDPLLDKLTLNYESARLFEIYSRCAYYSKRVDWEDAFKEAQCMYDQLHLHNQHASLSLFKGMVWFHAHDYGQSLKFILNAHEEIKLKSIQLDAMTTLDYLYIESILFSSIGDYDSAQLKMEEALAYSKEKRIFYRIEDLYRVACFQSIINGNHDERVYYLKKVRQYGEFAEDKLPIAIAELLEAHYYNSYANDYTKALEHIEQFCNLIKESETEQQKTDDNNHYLLEKGKSLYGLGKVKDALELLQHYRIPDYMHHPYDLLMAYEGYTYRALCYLQLGNRKQALQEAQIGADLANEMPDMLDIPYKIFIIDTLEQIKKEQ